MPVHITSRADAEAIIREQVVSTIFQDAPKQSVFMSLARKLPNMTSNQTRIRVLDFLPTAYWVNGDTGMKQTSKQALIIGISYWVRHRKVSYFMPGNEVRVWQQMEA